MPSACSQSSAAVVPPLWGNSLCRLGAPVLPNGMLVCSAPPPLTLPHLRSGFVGWVCPPTSVCPCLLRESGMFGLVIHSPKHSFLFTGVARDCRPPVATSFVCVSLPTASTRPRPRSKHVPCYHASGRGSRLAFVVARSLTLAPLAPLGFISHNRKTRANARATPLREVHRGVPSAPSMYATGVHGGVYHAAPRRFQRRHDA